MAAHKGQSWLEVVVKTSHDMESPVSADLSRFVPSLMWRSEKEEGGICLLKTAMVMDAQVDRIISKIEEALQRIEARHLLSESLPAELHIFEADEPTSGSRKEFRPGQVSPRLTIGPPIECVHAGEGQRLLLIEPQEAFGDGNHPSTRLALRLLDELLSGKYCPPTVVQGWVLDAGCGSGVLALAAAALGGFKALAVDLDPRAIDAARGNVRLNPGPGPKVFLALGELSCARGPFCVVLANLVPPVHARAYRTLWQAVAPGGWLILSGYCQSQKDSILRPYIQNGATERACLFDQAWEGTLLHKPEG